MKLHSAKSLKAEFLHEFDRSPIIRAANRKERDVARRTLLSRLASPRGKDYLARKAKRRAQKQARRITRLNRK